jgi:hypothetical protein
MVLEVMYSNTWPGGGREMVHTQLWINTYVLYEHCPVPYVLYFTPYDFEMGLNKMFLEDSLSGRSVVVY